MSPPEETEAGSSYFLAGIPYHTAFIPEGTPGRPGEARPIQYIVIHETGNTGSGATAASHSGLLIRGELGQTSWHYTVDDTEIYQHLPDGEIGWHAGDQRVENGGNLSGIGIELCVNAEGDFDKTVQNGALLAAFLLIRHDLSLSDIKQHYDFNGKNCPEHLRESGWDDFLTLVAQAMENPPALEQEIT